MRVLVTGWFSFEGMGATAGDLLACDLACDWLRGLGLAFDIAYAAPFFGGVDWSAVKVGDYTHVVFVCGPVVSWGPLPGLLERFREQRLVGLNVSMIESLDRWNPFTEVIERDSSRMSRPDITFASRETLVPVVGLILVPHQYEYADTLHELADASARRLCNSREMSIVEIDTRLDINGTGLRSPNEVVSLIARMDAIVTTRLHGTVLALKHGVPAVAIDPIVGGAKVKRQADTIGWPVVFTGDELDDRQLEVALTFCLSQGARTAARRCATAAKQVVEGISGEFATALHAVERRSH